MQFVYKSTCLGAHTEAVSGDLWNYAEINVVFMDLIEPSTACYVFFYLLYGTIASLSPQRTVAPEWLIHKYLVGQ